MDWLVGAKRARRRDRLLDSLAGHGVEPGRGATASKGWPISMKSRTNIISGSH